MNTKNQILVPIDFSNSSLKALDYATNIAQQINKKVVVVNIIQSPINQTKRNNLSFKFTWGSKGRNSINSLFTYKLYRKNKKRLKTLSLGWNNHHVISQTSIRITSKGTLEAMTDLVNQFEPFMLVLPYSSHSKFEQYFSSNSTLDILRNIDVPTLFVPENTVVKNIENIVLPSGFSEEVDLGFLDVIKRITNGFNSDLHLVKILEDQEQTIDAETKMRDFADRKSLRNHQVNSIVASLAEEALNIYQQSVKADLICLMTKGKSGFSQLFYSNSVTETLLKNTNKPILSMTIKNKPELIKNIGAERITDSMVNELTY